MGTGIGLALTKGIIELHHGSIEVYSEPGEGATFSVHLQTGKEHFTPEQISESEEDSPIEGNLLPDFAQNLLSEQETLNSDSYAEKKRDIKLSLWKITNLSGKCSPAYSPHSTKCSPLATEKKDGRKCNRSILILY